MNYNILQDITSFLKNLNIRNAIITAVLLCFTFACNRNEIIVNASDYGLGKGEDAVTAIRKALEVCNEKKASRLIIPPGKYDCFPMKATEQYLYVCTNDNSLKRIVFPLNGMKGFEIDGQGAEFIMHGQIVPFNVEYSENIKLKNFSVDWNKPFYFQGEVVAVNHEENCFDLQVFQECDYQIVANELIFLEKPNTAVKTWRQWPCPIEEEYGWEQNIDWNIWYDSKNKTPAYGHHKSILRSYNEKLGKRYHAEEIRPGLVRIFDATNYLPQIGWVLIVKGRKDKNRLSPAIHLFHNKNVTLENLNIYHAGGMGLIAERTDCVSLNNFNVVLPPSSGRLVTTTADATHFVNCKGLISFDNCTFENMLDDASNFHGIYTKIEDIVDDYTIGVRRMHGMQTGFLFAEPGDSIRLSNSKSMKPYALLEVADVNDINGEYMTLRFNTKIRDILRPESVADNISWQCDVDIRNSIVRRNRARSFLISTQGNVMIENNKFSTCTYMSLLFNGDATFWYESGPVRNVIIRNNTFKDFGLASGESPIIQFSPRVSFEGKPTHYYHKNIVFENNDCEVFGRKLVSARSVENFIFKGNTIHQSNDYPESKSKGETFSFFYSKGIKIENNKYLLENEATIKADKYSNVEMDGNSGIKYTIETVGK